MNIHWRSILFFLLISFSLTALLSVEQVYGLPIAFISLSVLWLDRFNWWQRLLVSLGLGLIVTTVYFLPLSGSVAVMMMAVWLFSYLRPHIASQTLLLLTVGWIVGVLIWLGGPTTFSIKMLISTLVSSFVVLGVSKVSLAQSKVKRHL